MADNVPQVLNASMGYVHSGNEYWITKEPNPTTADIVKCNGPEDPDCNAAAVKKAGTGDSSSGISKVSKRERSSSSAYIYSERLTPTGPRYLLFQHVSGKLHGS